MTFGFIGFPHAVGGLFGQFKGQGGAAIGNAGTMADGLPERIGGARADSGGQQIRAEAQGEGEDTHSCRSFHNGAMARSTPRL